MRFNYMPNSGSRNATNRISRSLLTINSGIRVPTLAVAMMFGLQLLFPETVLSFAAQAATCNVKMDSNWRKKIRRGKYLTTQFDCLNKSCGGKKSSVFVTVHKTGTLKTSNRKGKRVSFRGAKGFQTAGSLSYGGKIIVEFYYGKNREVSFGSAASYTPLAKKNLKILKGKFKCKL